MEVTYIMAKYCRDCKKKYATHKMKEYVIRFYLCEDCQRIHIDKTIQEAKNKGLLKREAEL